MQIYCLTNLTNGKVYVGKTIYLAKTRWTNHKAVSKRGKGNYLSNAIRKYGSSAFKFQVLAEAKDIEDLNTLEKYYIKKFNSANPSYGYNIRLGGEGGPMSSSFKENCRLRRLGSKHSEETKKKMSDSRTGWRKSNVSIPDPDSPPAEWGSGPTHGRLSTYNRHNCRCELCRKAKAVAGVKQWHRKHPK